MKKILYILRNNDFVLVPIYDDPALEKFSSKSEILSKLQVSFARVEGLEGSRVGLYSLYCILRKILMEIDIQKILLTKCTFWRCLRI